jgi:hypothetical protein
MVAGGPVRDVQPHRRGGQRLPGGAARIGDRFVGRRRVQVERGPLGLVGHLDQGGRVLRALQGRGDHDRDRLPEEMDPVVLEDAQPPSRRVVGPGVVPVRQPRRVPVADHREHAGLSGGGVDVDAGDPAAADRPVDHDGVHHAFDGVVGGEPRGTGHLEPAIHPRGGRSHGHDGSPLRGDPP